MTCAERRWFWYASALAWNLVEAVVAFWAGARVGSVALIAFGLDSIIELFAGGVLVWRLRQEGEGHEDEAAERRAQRLVGITFFVPGGVRRAAFGG